MRCLHSGDLGDIIACLPTIKALGGGELVISDVNGNRETMRGARFNAIKPLLESQSYITNVEWSEHPTGITHDFSSFRTKYQWHRNLALQQAEYLGVPIKLSRWLQVETEVNNQVIFARTLRYWNPIFPWRKLREAYPQAVFVGMSNEHQEFEQQFGKIEYRPTKDLLELACLLAGSKLLVSNQTVTWWIGAALGISTIQESYWADLNSVIDRDNSQYTRNVEEVNKLIDETV